MLDNEISDKSLIDHKIEHIKDVLLKLDGVIDVKEFLTDLEYHVGQLDYFYNDITPKQSGDPASSFYKLKQIPEPHQVAYFNLTRGFPKELYGGHWCYIVKIFKYKALVIPTTSVKDNSSPPDSQFQLDVAVENFTNPQLTRLQVSDLRVVDLQRLYQSKGFYNVLTSRNYIEQNISRMIFLNQKKALQNEQGNC